MEKYFIVTDSENLLTAESKERKIKPDGAKNRAFRNADTLPHYTHSFVILSYDRSKASFKATYSQRAIYCFLFQFPLSFSLRFSSSCLSNLPRLLVTFTLPPIYPSTTCFRRQCYARCGQPSWPSFCLLNVGYYFPP
jgi:hypothetical protein